MNHKLATIQVKARRKDGGRIIITTPAADRDRDRIFPEKINLTNYRANPVVLFGHSYGAAADVVGRTDSLSVSSEGIVADFTLRSAASDSDPQHIVRLLWAEDFIRTASIGFMPLEKPAQNELGGLDFGAIELLEWSMVPVPAHPGATALAAKSYPRAWQAYERRTHELSGPLAVFNGLKRLAERVDQGVQEGAISPSDAQQIYVKIMAIAGELKAHTQGPPDPATLIARAYMAIMQRYERDYRAGRIRR